jgi:hypothetical protein
METEPWRRSELLALAGVVIALIACIAAVLVVPEVRRYLALDQPHVPPSAATNAPDPAASPAVVPTQHMVSSDILPYAGVRDIPGGTSRRSFELRPNEIDAVRRGLIPYHGFMDDQALFSPQPRYAGPVRECTSLDVAYVEIKVDENGTVTSARETMVCEDLSMALEAAALATRFPPAVVDGRKVSVAGSIRYRIRQSR